MSVNKNLNRYNFFNISILIFLCVMVVSCRPALGSSWYSHSALGTENKTIIVKSITIKGVTIYPEENGEDFIGRVNVTDSELFPEDIEVFAVDKKNRKIDVSVIVKGEGGQAHLQEGSSVTVPIKIRDKNNPNVEVQKFLFLEQDSSMGGGGSDYNPKDPHGNTKFIIKITTESEEVDPWVYYKEGAPDTYDTDNFSTSKFDDWILNMTSINSEDVASYIFKPGTWQGENPAICSGPQISPGALNSAWNLQYYMYTSRFERWKNENGFDPNLNSEEQEKEKRFVFFKFTGNATGSSLNNSMFCLDTYSKFLFFYSEPAKKKKVLGHYIPSDWQDYAAPDKGVHVKSDIPFYKTDPVGFVKEDGSVVIYAQAQTNIAKAEYGPQQNPAYTEPAGKKSNKEGFSPYRNPTITVIKKTLIKTPNPKYTAVQPVILEQPKDVYAALNSPTEIKFEVKVAEVPEVPEGEQLSYQWYKSDNKNDDGTAVIDGINSVYTISDTSEETKCYFYCIVKNKNTQNGKTEESKTDYAKCHITAGDLQVDAAYPIIKENPKNHIVRMNSSSEITLKVRAESLDNGTLSYQWFKALNENDAGTEIENAVNADYTFRPDTAAAGILYYYCLVTNTNTAVSGEQTATRKSLYAKVEVEEVYKIEFSVAGGGGSLTALYRGKPIKSGDYIKKDEKIKFIASPEDGFYVKEWVNINPVQGLQDMTLAELTVVNNVNISVAFERRMRLTIRPKIKNESLKSWSTAGWVDHGNHKYIDGAHFAHDLAVTLTANGNTDNIQWKYEFPIEGSGSGGWFSGGYGEYVKDEDYIKVGFYKADNNFVLAKDFSGFSEMNILFKTYLIKSNRLDHWRSEWTTTGGGPVYPKQPLDNNSIIKLVYNETAGKWSLDAAALQLNQPERVTISYDENFTLADGEEKDFVITYTVNNNGYKHDEDKKYKDVDDGGENEASTRSKGTVKVIYTISWK